MQDDQTIDKEETVEELIRKKYGKVEVPIVKATNEEKRQATFVVLEPQNSDGTTSDLHLDWYDEEVVSDACRSFNKSCMKANLFHRVNTETFSFIESYITPVEFVLGDRYIKKGTWIATIEVEKSTDGDFIWEGIKSGRFNGLSIQALGTTEKI